MYQNLIVKGLDRIERWIGPSKLDFAESICVPGMATAAAAFACSYLGATSSQMAKISLAFGGIAAVSYAAFKKKILEMKINQALRHSIGNAKDGLILETTHDPAGSRVSMDNFCNRTFVSNLKQMTKRHFEMRRELIRDPYELKDSLRRVGDQSLDLLWIRAHGNREGATFSRYCSVHPRSYSFMELLQNKLKKGGRVLYEVCRGEQIARATSLFLPNATVYGDSGTTHSYTGFQVDRHGSARFNDGHFCKGQDTTRIFRNGRLVNTEAHTEKT